MKHPVFVFFAEFNFLFPLHFTLDPCIFRYVQCLTMKRGLQSSAFCRGRGARCRHTRSFRILRLGIAHSLPRTAYWSLGENAARKWHHIHDRDHAVRITTRNHNRFWCMVSPMAWQLVHGDFLKCNFTNLLCLTNFHDFSEISDPNKLLHYKLVVFIIQFIISFASLLWGRTRLRRTRPGRSGATSSNVWQERDCLVQLLDRPNLGGLVLGCIEGNFCK